MKHSDVISDSTPELVWNWIEWKGFLEEALAERGYDDSEEEELIEFARRQYWRFAPRYQKAVAVLEIEGDLPPITPQLEEAIGRGYRKVVEPLYGIIRDLMWSVVAAKAEEIAGRRRDSWGPGAS